MSSGSWIIVGIIILGLLIILPMAIKIVSEYERGVILRLGKYIGRTKGPGIIWIIPFVDQIIRVDLRLIAEDVPPQDVITRDNVSLKVNAVVYFRVVEPNRAIVEVENYLLATSKLAQTTLRSVLGQVELDELLASRESINHRLQTILQLLAERESRPKPAKGRP